MAEYIEREKVIDDIGELFTLCHETLPNECGHHFIVEKELETHLDFVRNLPAADVRPVVLCRDCVNYVESDDEANGEKMCVIDAEWCVEDRCYYGFTAYTPPEWFCAGGKKREES